MPFHPWPPHVEVSVQQVGSDGHGLARAGHQRVSSGRLASAPGRVRLLASPLADNPLQIVENAELPGQEVRAVPTQRRRKTDQNKRDHHEPATLESAPGLWCGRLPVSGGGEQLARVVDLGGGRPSADRQAYRAEGPITVDAHGREHR